MHARSSISPANLLVSIAHGVPPQPDRILNTVTNKKPNEIILE